VAVWFCLAWDGFVSSMRKEWSKLARLEIRGVVIESSLDAYISLPSFQKSFGLRIVSLIVFERGRICKSKA
jgi:hypothetical protein